MKYVRQAISLIRHTGFNEIGNSMINRSIVRWNRERKSQLLLLPRLDGFLRGESFLKFCVYFFIQYISAGNSFQGDYPSSINGIFEKIRRKSRENWKIQINLIFFNEIHIKIFLTCIFSSLFFITTDSKYRYEYRIS